MGFLSKLVGSGIGDAVGGIANVVDKFVETPDEKRAAEIVMRKLQQRPDEFQAEINKIEAAHRSIFVAGWRPFIGWVCGFGLAYEFVLRPFIQMGLAYLAAAGYITGHIVLPTVDTGELMTLVFALLGLGGLRSYEKKHKLVK